MPRDGRSLEKLTYALEKYIAGEDATVESPGFLNDRITDQKREIDVLITRGEGHHKQLVAIECKDRSRPIGVPDVEAFHTKVSDLNITKAVFVSSSGFRKSAITKAKFYNISCLDIDEVDQFDWLLTDCIHQLERNLLRCNWKLNTDNKDFIQSGNEILLDTSSGEEVTKEIIVANSRNILHELDLSQCENSKVYYQTVSINPENLVIVDTESGSEYPVKECEVYLEFQQIITDIPLKTIMYGDTTEDKGIARAAVAEVKVSNEINGHFMLVEQEDGSKKLILITNKNA